MAFQFVHVETYSIKTGGGGIAAEAGRTPTHCLHVENPQPPVVLHGTSPEDAWLEIERRHAASTSTVTIKGVERQRKMRIDENIMVAAVASYPTPTAEMDLQDPAFLDWQRRALDFFESEHGPALSAVLHLDETHPHIHYLTAPDLESGERIESIHRGLKAKAEAGGNRGKKVKIDRAYNDAMSSYQDAYGEQVGQYHAQARLGPAR